MKDGQDYAIEHDNNLTGHMTYRSSDKIREDIYQTLGDESGIDIDVVNGIVNVTGMVDTEEAIGWISDRIRDVKGVEDVKMNVLVKPFNH